MEGIAAVQARIAGIQMRFAPPASPAAPVDGGRLGSTTGISNASGSTFDDLLAGALGQTPATKRAPGAYPALEPPAKLRAYGNGKIPDAALESIGVGNHQLSSAAAQAFRTMSAAASRDGVTIGVTDSYRSYEAQVDVADRKGLYSQGGLAAQPGTSNHGWGLSLDLDVNDAGQQWLRDNAASYGFVEDTPREPWHWTFRPDPAPARSTF